MHVLAAFEYPSCNGGEHSWLATCDLLQHSGVRYSVVCPLDGPLADRLREFQIDVYPLYRRDEADEPLSQESVRARLAVVIGQVEPDLIHANSLAMSRLMGPVARVIGMPSLGHVRDIVRLSARAMADVNQNGRVLTVSDATLRYHIQQGADAGRWRVMYNGVDLDRFCLRSPYKTQVRQSAARSEIRRELQLDDKAVVLGSIGQIGMRKGLEVAAAAIRTVMNEFDHVHWVVVGERHSGKKEAIQYEQDLRARASQPPLMGRVHFIGGRKDVPALLRSFDILLHTAHQEPLGRVLLEASASGLAVIATDVGGTSEVFPHGTDTAILTAAGDVGAIVDAIRQLVRDAQLRATMGREARQRAVDVFSREAAANSLLLHYTQVAAREQS